MTVRLDLVYPVLTDKPDRAKYSVEIEDVALKSDMEGGYVSTRPRFYRNPRKTFSFGYTTLPDNEYQKLLEFWTEVKGGSEMFKYTDFDDGQEYMVRFKQKFSGKFTGSGITKYWDVDGIILEQV